MTFIILLYIFLGVLVVVAIVAIATFIVSKYLEKQPHITICLGKLSTNEVDDIEKATEYLKLTNNNEDGIL